MNPPFRSTWSLSRVIRQRRRCSAFAPVSAASPAVYSTPLLISIGTRLGPYEIVATLGAGGMGEVYRARDTTLNRDVAIKVLPQAFANDSERLARFTREAQTLAALNHPNIAHIHGLEASGGVPALVMELVEGEDLSQRIARGAIPIGDALPIARQIAEALEAAHEQGIIHRDLKPANIKVRPDGTVKVLDFGLAKAMEPPGTASSCLATSATITSPAMTQAGVILGTAAYMSPGAGEGPSARQAQRRLGVRRRLLRDADRPARVQGRGRVGDDGARPHARAGVDVAAGGDASADSATASPLPREGPQAAPRFGRRRAAGDRGGVECDGGHRRCRRAARACAAPGMVTRADVDVGRLDTRARHRAGARAVGTVAH